MRSANALIMKETVLVEADALGFSLFEFSASYDRPPNGACVPVGEPGPEIPADSLVKRRRVGTLRRYPV
jgi:hypothetical protein